MNESILLEALAQEEGVDMSNKQKRCICALLIDSSASVTAYQAELEAAFPAFLQSIADLSDNIELGVWSFNRNVTEHYPIRSVYDYEEGAELHLSPKGRTHTGEALRTVLDAIDHRQAILNQCLGTHCFVPVLVMLTDGNPNFTDDPAGKRAGESAWQSACDTLAERVAARTLQVVAIGVGERIHEENLRLLSGGVYGKPYVHLREVTDFQQLFQFITTTCVSASEGRALTADYGMGG